MTKPQSVYAFDSYRDFLQYTHDNYPGFKKPITLERWAKKLGFRSPRSIAMVLKGQRFPSADFVLAISQDLKHNESELRYCELLARKDKGKLSPVLEAELKKLKNNVVQRKPLASEIFSVVSGWQFYVLLQLVQTPAFREDPSWIEKRLGGALKRKEIESTLELLEKVRMLERNAEGKLCLSTQGPLITEEDIPSLAVQRHHKEQMGRASEALEKQGMLDREFTALTLRVKREDLPQVKKRIREFRDRFDKDFYDSDADDVCQLNIQFFFHTMEQRSS